MNLLGGAAMKAGTSRPSQHVESLGTKDNLPCSDANGLAIELSCHDWPVIEQAGNLFTESVRESEGWVG